MGIFRDRRQNNGGRVSELGFRHLWSGTMTAAGNRRTGPRIRLRGSSAGFKTSTPDDIYEELLEEALRNSREEGNRPLKRRKSGRDRQEVIVADESIQEGIEQPTLGNEREAVVITSSSNPSESDGEIEWDDVDLTALSKVEGQESKSSPVIREIALKSPSQNPTFNPFNGIH